MHEGNIDDLTRDAWFVSLVFVLDLNTLSCICWS